jgi:hypothetical protein
MVGGAVLTDTAHTQHAMTQINIAGMQPGTPPPGFSFARTGSGAAGDWRVVADPSAAGQKAIAQISRDRTDYRFPLAVYEAISARKASPDDYYVVRANALEDNVRFYRVVHGRRQQIQSADLKVTANQWHTLRLRAEGDSFTVSFDGKPLFTAQDTTFASPGKVALWTKADSVTHFDTIAITPLD